MTALQRLLLWLLALTLLAMPGVALFKGWLASERWPFERLRIEAEFVLVDEQGVREALRPHLERGFFALRPDRVRETLLTLPGVRSAQTRKRWPDLLEVRLEEHHVVARWGTDRLLSDQGLVFAVEGGPDFSDLPSLWGPEARAREVLAFHRTVGPLLASAGHAATAVELFPRGGWRLRLDDGSELLLGRTDVEPRLRRYVHALPELRRSESRPIGRADLRYANGFAIRWLASPPGADGGREQRTFRQGET